MAGEIFSHSDSFIAVIDVHIRLSSHHQIILSLAKCLLFYSYFMGRRNEVIVASLRLVLLDLSCCPNPPGWFTNLSSPPRLKGLQSIQLHSAQSLNELDSDRDKWKYPVLSNYGRKKVLLFFVTILFRFNPFKGTIQIILSGILRTNPWLFTCCR